MTKDELINQLMERLNDLTAQLNSAHDEIKSLRVALDERAAKEKADEEDLRKAKNQAKGMAKLIEKNNESQKPQLTEQELKTLQEARALQRKRRGNNKAKRDTHPEARVEYRDIYPDDPDFDKATAKECVKQTVADTPTYRLCYRYEYTPGYFTKIVYRIHKYSQNGKIYEGKTPDAAFFNSNYDASFVSGLMQLRYMYGMPVERIIHYFSDMGFDLNKPTADFLLKKTGEAFTNFYAAIRRAVLGDDYIAADETYYKILVPEKNAKGKGVRKGYFWVLLGIKSGLVCVVYEDGSRGGDVIYKQVADYKGTLQSDAASFYKTIESEKFPNIVRIACLQHIKRKFLDCQDSEPDAKKMVALINKLYHEEHKHKIGKDGWSAEGNLKWRQEYAPDILTEIRKLLDAILSRTDLPPGSDLHAAARYMDKEWSALSDIFKRGDTYLDNNHVELLNRYFSISQGARSSSAPTREPRGRLCSTPWPCLPDYTS